MLRCSSQRRSSAKSGGAIQEGGYDMDRVVMQCCEDFQSAASLAVCFHQLQKVLCLLLHNPIDLVQRESALRIRTSNQSLPLRMLGPVGQR